MDKKEELLQVLVKNNILRQEELPEIKQKAQAIGKKVEDFIVEKQLIDAEELVRHKADVYGLLYENLLEKKVSDKVLSTIPSEVAENYKIVCFDRNENEISVGITDPDNFKAIEAVDFLSKEAELRAKYYLISAGSFRAAFKQYKTYAKELSKALKTREEEEKKEESEKEQKQEKELTEVIKSAPVIKIVSVIIRHAVEGGASDIHVEPLKNDSRVRYRIDGILHTTLVLPRSVHDAIVARIKVMSNLKLDETRVPQDGRIRLTIDDKDVDFRVSVLPVVGAEKVVMRILETEKKAPTLEELGYQGIQLKIVNANLEKTEGMMLATGPTGSGKSSTLFAILHILNKESVNISTLEDPVEYMVKGVNQSQIKPDIGYTFASGLRSFLRQDPDIIMVGEIRDEETAELAIHSALTGHYVLSTLHTTSAAGAITRLVDMKVESFLLGSTMHTVIAQRLARKICLHCREKIEISEAYLRDTKEEIKKITPEYIKTVIKDFDPEKPVFYRGKGCPRCGNTGYSGRIAILEVLDINDKLKDAIISGKKHLSEEEINESQKFITMKQDGIIKMLAGTTTMEEILRVCEN